MTPFALTQPVPTIFHAWTQETGPVCGGLPHIAPADQGKRDVRPMTDASTRGYGNGPCCHAPASWLSVVHRSASLRPSSISSLMNPGSKKR